MHGVVIGGCTPCVQLRIRCLGKHLSENCIRIVARDFLTPGDRVIIIDEFLASGKTIDALASLVQESGAELVGIGAVIEKAFEGGRERLAYLDVPIESVVIIESMDDDRIVFR